MGSAGVVGVVGVVGTATGSPPARRTHPAGANASDMIDGVGLDAAGKTTILYKLKLGEVRLLLGSQLKFLSS